jgi:hypothetical protein
MIATREESRMVADINSCRKGIIRISNAYVNKVKAVTKASSIEEAFPDKSYELWGPVSII